jgi:hypothetical protein
MLINEIAQTLVATLLKDSLSQYGLNTEIVAQRDTLEEWDYFEYFPSEVYYDRQGCEWVAFLDLLTVTTALEGTSEKWLVKAGEHEFFDVHIDFTDCSVRFHHQAITQAEFEERFSLVHCQIAGEFWVSDMEGFFDDPDSPEHADERIAA